MGLIAHSQSSYSGLSITAMQELIRVQFTVAGVYRASVRITNLTNTAANITIAWKHCDSNSTELGGHRFAAVSKVNDSDTQFAFEIPGVYVAANEYLEVFALSDNASDTNISYTIDWINESYSEADVRTWVGTEVSGAVPISSGGAHLPVAIQGVWNGSSFDTITAAVSIGGGGTYLPVAIHGVYDGSSYDVISASDGILDVDLAYWNGQSMANAVSIGGSSYLPVAVYGWYDGNTPYSTVSAQSINGTYYPNICVVGWNSYAVSSTLINGTNYCPDINVMGWNGYLAQNTTINGTYYPDINVVGISGDSDAADNLEAALDGTGGVTLSLSQLKIVSNTTEGCIDLTNVNSAGYGIKLYSNYIGVDIQGDSMGGSIRGNYLSDGVGGGLEIKAQLGGTGLFIGGFNGTTPIDLHLAGTGQIRSGFSGTATYSDLVADSVWDEATSGHTASGSFGKLIGTTWAALFTGITSMANWLRALVRSSTPDSTALSEINTGGGTYTAGTDSLEALGTQVAPIATSVGNVVALSPVVNGTLEVVRGDCYRLTDGRQIVFTKPSGSNWPSSLSGWTITLSANKASDNDNTGTGTFSATGTVSVATGDGQSVYFDTAIPTTLAVGTWDFDVQASHGSGNAERATLVIGAMRVLEDQTP